MAPPPHERTPRTAPDDSRDIKENVGIMGVGISGVGIAGVGIMGAATKGEVTKRADTPVLSEELLTPTEAPSPGTAHWPAHAHTLALPVGPNPNPTSETERLRLENARLRQLLEQQTRSAGAPTSARKRPAAALDDAAVDRATSSPIMDVPLSDFARISPALRSPCNKRAMTGRFRGLAEGGLEPAKPAAGAEPRGPARLPPAAMLSPRAQKRSSAARPRPSGDISSKSPRGPGRCAALLVPETEEYSRLRLASRRLPALALRHAMADRVFASISTIVAQHRGGDLAFERESWATIGVVTSVRAHAAADASSGSPLFSFVLATLGDHAVRAFVLGRAASDQWQPRLKFGQVVAVFNARVLSPSDPAAPVGLEISDAAQLLQVGTSFDFSRCRAATADGHACGRILKRAPDAAGAPVSDLCDDHLLAHLQHSQRRRQEFAAGTATVVLGDPRDPAAPSFQNAQNTRSRRAPRAPQLPAAFLRATASKIRPPSSARTAPQPVTYSVPGGAAVTTLHPAAGAPQADAGAALGMGGSAANDKVIDLLRRQPNAGGKYLRAGLGSPGGGASGSDSLYTVFSARDINKMGFHPSSKSHLGVAPPAAAQDARGDASPMAMCSPLKSPRKFASINQSSVLSPSAMRRAGQLAAPPVGAGLGSMGGRRLFGGDSGPSVPAGPPGAAARRLFAPAAHASADADVAMASPFKRRDGADILLDVGSSDDERDASPTPPSPLASRRGASGLSDLSS